MNIKYCDCGGEFQVIDSRQLPTGDIKRKRTCPLCGKNFLTFEISQDDFLQMVKIKEETERKYNELLERLKR